MPARANWSFEKARNPQPIRSNFRPLVFNYSRVSLKVGEPRARPRKRGRVRNREREHEIECALDKNIPVVSEIKRAVEREIETETERERETERRARETWSRAIIPAAKRTKRTFFIFPRSPRRRVAGAIMRNGNAGKCALLIRRRYVLTCTLELVPQSNSFRKYALVVRCERGRAFRFGSVGGSVRRVGIHSAYHGDDLDDGTQKSSATDSSRAESLAVIAPTPAGRFPRGNAHTHRACARPRAVVLVSDRRLRKASGFAARCIYISGGAIFSRVSCDTAKRFRSAAKAERLGARRHQLVGGNREIYAGSGCIRVDKQNGDGFVAAEK